MSPRNGGSVSATPTRAEVVAGVKRQLVDAGLEAIAGEQRRVGAAVSVGDGRGDQPSRRRRRARCSSMATPLAGTPRAVSSTWVDRRAIYRLEPQPETAVRRPRIGVDAELVAALGNRIPRAVVRFEMHLRDRRDLGRACACPSGRSAAGCCPTRTVWNTSCTICAHLRGDAGRR